MALIAFQITLPRATILLQVNRLLHSPRNAYQPHRPGRILEHNR